MEPRYVFGSIIGIAALLAIALVPILRNNTIGRIALFLLFATFAYNGITGVRGAPRARQDALASLILSPQVKAAILASPGKLLYTQDIDLFGFASLYGPDADMRERMALVYSSDEEMRWNYTDVGSMTVLHLKSFTPYIVLPYESLATQPGEHIFAVSRGGRNWIEQAFAAEHVEVKPIGNVAGCEVVSVRFPNSAAAASPPKESLTTESEPIPGPPQILGQDR
jgi:hypothetical protein